MLARLGAFLLLLLMVSSFRGSSVPNALSAERRDNIEYGQANGVSLRLDASLPQGIKNAPAVIIVHGGGWVAGDRRINVQPLFKPLSDAGFAWFSVSYRLAADITQFGAGIDDVAQAIRFVKAHATEFKIDPEKVALVGESAGGQLALMAALRRVPATSVKAVVALYTPTDLVSLAKSSEYIPSSIRKSVQGTPWEGIILGGLAQLSPINNVRRDMPAILFIHGTADALVPFRQSQLMCDAMRKVNASCDIYRVEGGGHGIRWWEAYPQLASAYKQKMVEWLDLQLGGAGAGHS